MKKRLFAYGCSYSQYIWPMWPNVLGQSFDYTENYGKSGAGNLFLFYRFIYSMSVRNLTANDTVIIQWSGPSRYDYLSDGIGSWWTGGDNVTERFVTAGLDDLNSDSLALLKTIMYMNAAAEILNKTPAKWYFMYLNEYAMVHKEDILEKYNTIMDDEYVDKEFRQLQENLRVKYSDHLIDETGIYDHVMDTFGPNPWKLWNQSEGHEGFRDSHPTPKQTLSYIKNVAAKKITGLDFPAMAHYADYTENLIYKNTVGQHAQGDLIFRPATFHNIFVDLEKRRHSTGFSPVTNCYYHGKEEQ